MNNCDYGCGQPAIIKFKNGKWCCSKHANSCPVRKEELSITRQNYDESTRLTNWQNTYYNTKMYAEPQSVSVGTPFALDFSPLISIDEIYNATTFEEWDLSNFTILNHDNSTINMSFFTEDNNLLFNYTARTRNVTGISPSATILLSISILLFVIGIVFYYIKIAGFK